MLNSDCCHCEEPFDRPLGKLGTGLRINSATKQSPPLLAFESGRLLRYARNDILCCATTANLINRSKPRRATEPPKSRGVSDGTTLAKAAPRRGSERVKAVRTLASRNCEK